MLINKDITNEMIVGRPSRADLALHILMGAKIAEHIHA